jgi:multiple sugar transport system substrate-binding protein
MQVRAILLAATLALAPPAACAADLVVWWEEGYNPEEDAAVKEIIAAFEHKTGKDVELVLRPQTEIRDELQTALAAGRRPPDFVFTVIAIRHYDRWASEGRLVDLTDTLGPLAAQFDPDALARGTLLDRTTGRRGLYLLTMGFATHHVHVWRDLLERAGFTLADIPKEWEPFWSFWCDTVQPAVRRATGRDDIWGVGLPMSAGAVDTENGFWQFVAAYEAEYVTPDGRLVIEQPLVRNRLAKVLASYTAIWRKGCTPPDAVGWDATGNNKASLAQTVVMTPNATLSIPNALKAARREDYYTNAVTIEWPDGAHSQPLAIETSTNRAAVFKGGGHEEAAKEFVRFLVGEGWLAHWLDFVGDRILPPMPALAEQPFWLDPSDPHRMRSAVQFLTRPRTYYYEVVSRDWRHTDAYDVWPEAIQRIVTQNITPEHAADEAITRVKQILSE